MGRQPLLPHVVAGTLISLCIISGVFPAAAGSTVNRVVEEATRTIVEWIDWTKAQTAPDAEPLPAEIDWGSGVLCATGRGALPTNAKSLPQAKLMAIGAAEMDAHRQLAATLYGLVLRSQRISEEFAIREYALEEKVRAVVRGAQTREIHPLPDGNVEVTVELRLHIAGGKADVALPAPQAGVAPVAQASDPGKALRDYVHPEMAYGSGSLAPYTGIVIDARHTSFRRSRNARLLDEKDTVLLPLPLRKKAGEEAVQPFTFTRELTDAADPMQVGDNPLFLSALRSAGDDQTDLVVRDHDAALLRKLSEMAKIITQGRVLIVY